MIHEASAMTVRKNLGALLNEVQYHHDTIVIKKAGKAVAALVDIHYFKKICQIKERFEHLTNELGQTYKDVDADIAEAEISEAIKAARKTNE